MNLLTQNGKMKKTSEKTGFNIFNFNISQYNNKTTGKITCPFAGSCKKFCFAGKGNYVRYPKITELMDKKHTLTLSSKFPQLMDEAIKAKRKLNFVRIHDSGDFYSPKYLNKWLEIIRKNPTIKFYAYTKSHTFLTGLDIPDNFDYIKSYGGKHDDKINDSIDRHAKIFPTHEDIKNAGYMDASDNDLLATKWMNPDNHKIGLIKH